MLGYAKNLDDLKSPPNNRLEKLTMDLVGFHSIRVNDQWRIQFQDIWDKNDSSSKKLLKMRSISIE